MMKEKQFINKSPVILFLLFLNFCSTGPAEESDLLTELPPSEEFDANLGTWSPDGRKFLFQHSDLSGDIPKPQQLWVADLETGERSVVFDGPSLNADWSPDGNWVAFHTNAVPADIFKYDMENNQLVILTGNDPNDLRHKIIARWSPDGSEILFTVGSSDENRGVFVMDSDGTDARTIIPSGVGGNWFPDGERIVYVNWDTEQPQGRQRQLFTASRDGTNQQKLTDLDDSDFVSSPAVSSDGKKIAFLHKEPEETTNVYIMDADGSDIERITRLGFRAIASNVRWHPSENKILFTVFIPNVSRRIYIMDMNTREIESLFPPTD